MTGAELIEAAKSASAVAVFISGGGMEAAIATVIGDIHTDAAKLALSMSSSSNTPSDRVKSAITHLEAAHVAYRRTLESADNSLLGPFPRMVAVGAAREKDTWVCSLMAICYAHLDDAPAVARAIAMARQTAEQVEPYPEGAIHYVRGCLGLLAGIWNPENWILGAKNVIVGCPPGMSPSEIDSLAKSLEGVLEVT